MNTKAILIIAVLIALLLIKYWNFFLFVRGLQALKKEQYDKAVKLIKGAARSGMKPKNKLTCGYVLLTRGFEEDAEAVLKPLLGIREKKFSHEEAIIYYSLLQWSRGEVDQAVEALKNLKEEGYTTTILYTNLGFYLLEQGDLAGALELNLEAREYNDSSKGIMDNLGATYIRMGNWEKAIPLFDELMETNPAFPEAWYHYAQVLNHQSKKEEALAALAKGLEQKFTHISTVKREKLEKLKEEIQQGDTKLS